jgi:hypothetical protein
MAGARSADRDETRGRVFHAHATGAAFASMVSRARTKPRGLVEVGMDGMDRLQNRVCFGDDVLGRLGEARAAVKEAAATFEERHAALRAAAATPAAEGAGTSPTGVIDAWDSALRRLIDRLRADAPGTVERILVRGGDGGGAKAKKKEKTNAKENVKTQTPARAKAERNGKAPAKVKVKAKQKESVKVEAEAKASKAPAKKRRSA